jgi:hypothetical protein
MPNYFEENIKRYQEAVKRGELSFGTVQPKQENPLWLQAWKRLLKLSSYPSVYLTGTTSGAIGGWANILSGNFSAAEETFKERLERQKKIFETIENVHDTFTALKATGAVLLDSLLLNPLEFIGDLWVDIGRSPSGLGFGLSKALALASGDRQAAERVDIYAQQYLKWLDWKRIGALATLVDITSTLLGIAPKRQVYVRDKETGEVWVYQERTNLLPAFRKIIEQNGGEVISVSGATSFEEGYSAGLYIIDILTPIPNSFFTGIGKLAWVVPKAEIRLGGMGVKALSAIVSKTPLGKTVEKTILSVEKNIGIPLTEKSIQFMRVLSPLQRIRNAKVEQAKQIIADVEEYLVSGGGRFGRMLENDPEGLYSRYGAAVDGLIKDRQKIEERYKQYLEIGMSKAEAKEAITQEVRKAQALSLFALTGLPFNDEVIEILQKADANPDEAYKIIKAWANERGYSPDMKVIQTIINGDYHLLLGDKTIDANFAKTLEGVVENPQLFLHAFLSPSKTIDELQKIWMSGVDYSKADWRNLADLTNDEIRLIEKAVQPYRSDIANRLGRSLVLFLRSGDPAERQVIGEMIGIFLGSRGRSLEALAKRLGREEGDAFEVLVNALERLENPSTAKQVLRHLQEMQGLQMDNLKLEIDALRKMLERNGLGDLEILLSKCTEAVATETAKLSKLLALPPIEMAYNVMTDVGGSAVHLEDVLRSRVLQALEAKGQRLSDQSEEVLRWLGGDISFLRPVVMESEYEAVKFLRDITFASGLDENLLFATLDANKHIQNLIATTLGYVPDNLSKEMEATIFNWDTWKQALAEYAGRLESIGRIKQASDIHYALEKTDNIVDMINALRGIETENHILTQLRNDAFGYFGALMWRKDRVIHEANRVLDDLAETRHMQGFGFFSEAPTATLFKRIEGTGTRLDGLYTTEYIENVIKRLTQGDDRLWKGWLDAFNNYLKKALVVWSPLAIFRDFVSNAGSIAFGMDLAPYQYPSVLKWYLSAWRSVRNGDRFFQEYAKFSPSAYTIADTIGSLEHEVTWGLAEASAPKRLLYKIGQLPFFKQMQKLRSFSETLGKIAFVHAIEDTFKDMPNELLLKHFNADERYFVGRAKDSMAVRVALAEKYLIDYNDVPPAIHFLRRYTGLFPFITWEAKIINVLLSDWSSRTVFMQRLFHALASGEKIANADAPQQMADVNVLKGYLRDNPLAIGYKDENGKIRIIDFSYFLPMGALLPLERIANNMLDVDTYLKEIRTRMGTIVPSLFEVLLNRDLFTGAEIYRKSDPPEEKIKKIVQHLGDNVPVPIVPKRLISNYIKDMENETNIQEAFKQYNQSTWWEALLSMYTIDPDKLMITKAQQHMRTASRLLSEAKKAYINTLNKTGSLREAEEAMEPFLREAEHQRFKAHELYESGYRLHNVDKETSVMLLNPSVSYNPTLPREYIKAQTEVMSMIYDRLRENGAFQQKTDKWDILEILVNTAERFFKGVDAIDDINHLYSILLDAIKTNNRDVLRNWMVANVDAIKQNDSNVPLELPLLFMPQGVDQTAIASWFIAKLGRNHRYDVNGKPLGIQPSEFQQLFENIIKETSSGGSSSKMLLEAFNRWANATKKQFVPSQGNVPVAQRGLRGENR